MQCDCLFCAIGMGMTSQTGRSPQCVGPSWEHEGSKGQAAGKGGKGSNPSSKNGASDVAGPRVRTSFGGTARSSGKSSGKGNGSPKASGGKSKSVPDESGAKGKDTPDGGKGKSSHEASNDDAEQVPILPIRDPTDAEVVESSSDEDGETVWLFYDPATGERLYLDTDP